MLTKKQNPIFTKFAYYYDVIYADKEYEKECDFIEEIFREYLHRQPQRILDLACGAGGHSLILAKKGYEVTGIDLSKIMIRLAKEKTRTLKLNVDFKNMDMVNFSVKNKFDACICMFCSLDYLKSTNELKKTLENIKNHLQKDGILIFDFWNGLAVINKRPETRVKIMPYLSNGRIIRIATPEINLFQSICKIKYHCIVVNDSTILDEFEETHCLRFYFIEELKQYLKDVGFETLRICPLLKFNQEPNIDDWYLALIAKSIDLK